MKTIQTNVYIKQPGQLILDIPEDIPVGEHKIVVVIDEKPEPIKRKSLLGLWKKYGEAPGVEEIEEMRQNMDFINSYQEHLFTMSENCTKKEVGDWVEEQCKTRDLVIVDSLSVITAGKEVWIEDQLLMNQIKRAAKKNNSRVLLITHPKNMQGKNLASMDNLAGGAAYQRLAQCILWLTGIDAGDYECLGSEGERLYLPANKMIKVMKMRNGFLKYGNEILYDFDQFRFNESGFQ